MLKGVATVSLFAEDVDQAKAWYTELLGVEAYFHRSGPDGRTAYVEFRIGDRQTELGIIDRRYAPRPAAPEAGGAILYWHVDDLDATLDKLRELGAKEYEARTERGPGFVTASVTDPFGNVIGVMHNQHYLDVLGG
ncbi:VOC family protein [Streptomyces sp. NPDC091292]|uniref:VOC family protein n=1 Tax=Streptomyces sp. NPDC091292 TaxID=3365991 RepID=UPI003808C1EF